MSNLLVSAGALRSGLIPSEQPIVSERGSVTWRELAGSRQLSASFARCVMIRTCSQVAAARALIELDGIASRIVLCPAELPDEQCLSIAQAADVEVVVLDEPWDASHRKADSHTFERVILEDGLLEAAPHASSGVDGEAHDHLRGEPERPLLETEWILLTSGTTSAHKLVGHTLSSLTCGIHRAEEPATKVVWSTFYDIRRYGGLQIFLRAAFTGAKLVLSSKHETMSEYLARARAAGVTHISGTPSHWRRALMSGSAGLIAPQYVRLSGEIADQTILDQLRHQYPEAAIVHAFASTEAGVVFEVSDGLAGIPAERLGRSGDLETRIESETLRVRSPRNASRYLSQTSCALKDGDGFIDTRDILTFADGRYFFGGRQDGAINVGGLKVHPEEVESVLNSHPEISLSLVRAKRSPVIGAVVVADVLLRRPELNAREAARICEEGMMFCRERLPAYKVPVLIRPVPSLPIADTGKLARPHA